MKFRPLRHKVTKKLKVKKEYILPLRLGVFVAKKMKAKFKQSGLTLTEMTVVVASIVLLAAIALPAVRAFFNSFETESGAKTMVSAALSSARAIALKERHYAGIRFQKAYNRGAIDPLDPLTASQYMIFIIHDSDPEPNGTGLANGFRAVEGLQPIKLPDSIGVTDLTLVQRSLLGNNQISFVENPIDVDTEIDSLEELRDTTTFSVIFSPSGKLVTYEVRIRNKNGRVNDSSNDDIFNTAFNVETSNIAMFHQDDYLAMGLGPEYSRLSFIIYDAKKLKLAYERKQAYSGYLNTLLSKAIYINPYTGTIISTD
jgi:Tfp pilus assembly protein PilE/ribosomal protein L24